MDPFISPVFEKIFTEYPLRMADIGAAGALRAPWSKASKYLHVYAFEPGARADAIFQNRHATVFPVALSDHSGSETLYETKKPDASSLLRPSDSVRVYGGWDRFNVVKEYPVPVDTLDHVVDENGIPYIDFLKIDTQGTELAVLLGAERTLQSVFGIHVEINFLERYQGQSYFSDVDPWLRERGFVLYDIERRYLKLDSGIAFGGPRGALIKGDALYLRNTPCPGQNEKSDLLRHMAVTLVYGYVDVAYGLYSAKKELFPHEEQREIERCFVKTKPFMSLVPVFRGRVRMAKLFGKFHSLLRPSSKIGSSGDDVLGNL